MIVIAIIGLLATIALPNFISYRKRAYNAAANTDVKNLFTAAQAYFNDNPTATTNLNNLKSCGFRQASYVTVTVAAGTESSFEAAAYHRSGDRTYTINAAGVISS